MSGTGLTFVCGLCLQPRTTTEDADMPTLERTVSTYPFVTH